MSRLASVIVPNYNHARFLPQRIESVLNQTVRDIEVILLDDCSTDESREVLSAYAAKDDRVRTHFNETNSGSTFRQWDLGVSLARGEYVWIAESDDWTESELLATLVSMLDSHPDMSLAFCNSIMHFGDAEDPVGYTDFIATRYPEISRMLAEDFVMPGERFVAEALHRVNAIPNASAVVFRKRDYDTVGGAPRDMRLIGDWVTYARLCERHAIGYSAQPLNHNRIHGRTVRMTVGLTFPSVDEVYRLWKDLRRRFDIPRHQIALANREYFDEWSERVWLRNALPAFVTACRGAGVDPRLPWRVVRHLCGRVAGKIGVLAKAPKEDEGRA